MSLLKFFLSDTSLVVEGIIAVVTFILAFIYVRVRVMQICNEELTKRVKEQVDRLKLAQAQEIAKAGELAQMRDEFFFIAAHELRTPITIIRGFLSLALESEEKLPPPVGEYLHTAAKAGDALDKILGDILMITRSETGRLKIEVKPIELTPILESSLHDVQSDATKKAVSVSLQGKEDAIRVIADASRLKEILDNLLSNAVTYNRKGGSVFVRAAVKDSMVEITIEDTGYGIPKDKQDKIFQKFFRVDHKETREIMGAGLGLFITRMLVEKMGGKIWYTSIEGKGSSFCFLLPHAM